MGGCSARKELRVGCSAVPRDGLGDVYAYGNDSDAGDSEFFSPDHDCLIEDNCFAFPGSYQGVKEIETLLKGLTAAMLKDLEIAIEGVHEANGSFAYVTWHLEWNGKKLPFTRGCCSYEYAKSGEEVVIKKVEMTIDSLLKQWKPHLVKPKVACWSPRVILLRGFLRAEECDYLINIAQPSLESSLVVDGKTGKIYQSTSRTSYGMFLNENQTKHPIVQAIEKRIATFSHIPEEYGESIQVLRYQKNQHFTPHHDYFNSTYGTGNARVATMLMYLNDNFEGGETYFPKAGDGECYCGGLIERGWSIKPVRGDAILFWNMGLDGEMDPNTLHSGCDVLEGEKWLAIKWLHQEKFF